jgi:hypothetical protein
MLSVHLYQNITLKHVFIDKSIPIHRFFVNFFCFYLVTTYILFTFAPTYQPFVKSESGFR